MLCTIRPAPTIALLFFFFLTFPSRPSIIHDLLLLLLKHKVLTPLWQLEAMAARGTYALARSIQLQTVWHVHCHHRRLVPAKAVAQVPRRVTACALSHPSPQLKCLLFRRQYPQRIGASRGAGELLDGRRSSRQPHVGPRREMATIPIPRNYYYYCERTEYEAL